MTTQPSFKMLPLLAASAALFVSGAANALYLAFDDTATGGYDLITPVPGVSGVYSGSVGNFEYTFSTVLSDPTGGLNLGALQIKSTADGSHTLIVSAFDTYTPSVSVSSFSASGGGSYTGTQGGSVSFTLAQYAMNTGGLPVTGYPTALPLAQVVGIENTVAGSAHPLKGVGGAWSNSANAFDLRIDVAITQQNKGAYTQFTANITPTTVPIPAAAVLFGSGLLGMIGIGRRKLAHS